MKVIAIRFLNDAAPYFIEAFQYQKGEFSSHPLVQTDTQDTCVAITTSDRMDAMQFEEEEAKEVQRTLRDSIAKYIINGSVMMYKVFKDACSVLIEDAAGPTKPFVMKLVRIRRKDRPWEQTASFIQSVDMMLRSTTIEGNYEMHVTTDMQVSLRAWWKYLDQIIASRFPNFTPEQRKQQFSFEFSKIEIRGTAFWSSGSINEIDCTDIKD